MAVFLCRCINVIMSTVLGQAATCLAVAARKMSFHVGDLGAKGVSDCSGWLGGGGGGGSFRLLRLVGWGGGGGGGSFRLLRLVGGGGEVQTAQVGFVGRVLS